MLFVTQPANSGFESYKGAVDLPAKVESDLMTKSEFC